MFLTQNQIDVLKLNLRKKHIRLELLDFNFKTIDSIEGQAISGSLTFTADNAIRRSGQIEMAIPVSPQAAQLIDQLNGFTIESGGKIWIDKYIKIFVGIDDISLDNNITWYNMGIYLINSPERIISGNDFSVSFECIDLMAKLTGLRQGQLTGMATTIPFGYYDENNNFQKNETKEALVSVITELGGFSKYEIYPIPESKKFLPYEIKVGIGATVYDILNKFLDILATWQMYFNNDGILIIEPIPSGKNAIVYNIDAEQYISDSTNCDFENVKNQIVIYGRLNTLTYFAENSADSPSSVEYSGNSLILRYEKINTETLNIGGTTFGFHSLNTPNTNIINNVKIYSEGNLLLDGDLVKFENSTKLFGIEYETPQIEIGMFEPDEIYFIRIFNATQFKNSSDLDEIDLTQPIIFEFMGKQQVSYNLVNDNKESPFYINNNLGDNNYYAGLAQTPQGNNQGEGYELTLNDEDSPITSLLDGTIITFQANALNSYAENSDFTFININSSNGNNLVSNAPIVQNVWEQSNGQNIRPYIQPAKIDKDYTIWMLRYEKSSNTEQFVLVGRNPSALTLVLSGGEFDNIYSDQLAYERCLWELFNHSNMNNNITLGVVPNYLIDVNCKISYSQNTALPRNVYNTQPFVVSSGEYNEENLVSAYDNQVYTRYNDVRYFLTKTVTYPLGVDSTAQTITAIQIYDSGNLIGSDYKN